VQVAVGGGGADAGVAGEAGCGGSVAEPALHQYRLGPDRRGASPGAGAQFPASVGQELGPGAARWGGRCRG
jgi:hypothetical protein